MVIYVCATFVTCTLYIISIICTGSLALYTGDFLKVSSGMFFVSFTIILRTKHNDVVVNKFISNNLLNTHENKA